MLFVLLALLGCFHGASVECRQINNELKKTYDSRVANNNALSEFTIKHYEKRISSKEHSFYFSRWFVVDEELYRKTIYLTDKRLEVGCLK